MPDKKLTDSEIVKAKELIKKLGEAYDNYYDSSKGMPYDIDTTLLHSAICFKNCLNELNRLQAEKQDLEVELKAMRGAANGFKAENERLKNHIQEGIDLAKQIPEMMELVKFEAYKEFAEKLNKEFSGVGTCNYGYIHHKTRKVLKELVGGKNVD